MTVYVNSKPEELPDNASVATLLTQLKVGEKRVAVEVNQQLVTRAEWPAHILKSGDKIEVVSFVGGG